MNLATNQKTLVNIRQFITDDLPSINHIVASLHPRWFDDLAVTNIPLDLEFQKVWVAINDDLVVGFVSVRSQDGRPFIGWLGVSLNERNHGVGSALLNQAEEAVIKYGGHSLRVETVVEQTPPDNSYDETIKFYLARGFSIESKSKHQTFEEFVYRKGILIKNL